MCRPTFTVLLVVVACAGVHLPVAADEIALRVMSFNVRWDGLDKTAYAWVHRRPVALDVIKAHHPDVVGLQEPSLAQTRDLDEGLEHYASFIGDHTRDQHITHLYRSDRFTLADGGSFWLVETSDLTGGTRRCVWIRLIEKETGKAFYVYNNHWDHRSPASREESVRSLVHGIRHRAHNDPFIVLGDFNEIENGSPIKWLKGKGPPGSDNPPGMVLVDAYEKMNPSRRSLATGHGFSGRREGVRIDFIFVRSQDKVLDARIVYDNQDGFYPSDHYPVTAEIQLVTDE